MQDNQAYLELVGSRRIIIVNMDDYRIVKTKYAILELCSTCSGTKILPFAFPIFLKTHHIILEGIYYGGIIYIIVGILIPSS